MRPRLDPSVVAAALDLTPSQSQVAVMLSQGRSVQDIAATTGRQPSTVRQFLKQTYNRRRLTGRADLVRLVLSLSDCRVRDPETPLAGAAPPHPARMVCTEVHPSGRLAFPTSYPHGNGLSVRLDGSSVPIRRFLSLLTRLLLLRCTPNGYIRRSAGCLGRGRAPGSQQGVGCSKPGPSAFTLIPGVVADAWPVAAKAPSQGPWNPRNSLSTKRTIGTCTKTVEEVVDTM